MSKIFRIFFIVLIYFIFLSFINKVQANEDCKLYIGETTKYVNSNNIVINIYMENVNTQITTLGLYIEYDTSKLQFISSKSGKDLHATVKLAENIQEKGKVSIAALALDGFKNDGLYYSITFRVLDDSADIPIKLAKKEVTDKGGNDVNIETQGNTIKISKEKIVIEKSPQNQRIEKFKVIEQNEYTNLDTYIQEQGKIKVIGNDILVYEIENNEVAEIQDDGTIIPVKDGTTNVRVKLNKDTIGNIVVKVKNKKIKSISATGEIKEFQATSSSQDVQLIENNIEEENKLAERINIEKEKNNIISSDDESNNKKYIVVVIISIVLFILVTYVILKNKFNRKGGNFYR